MLGLINIFTMTVMETIDGFLEPYINQLLGLLTGLDIWLQAIVILVIAAFFLTGLIIFIKKKIVAFIVIAVIAAIFWFVYSQGYLDSFLTINIPAYFNLI